MSALRQKRTLQRGRQESRNRIFGDRWRGWLAFTEPRGPHPLTATTDQAQPLLLLSSGREMVLDDISDSRSMSLGKMVTSAAGGHNLLMLAPIKFRANPGAEWLTERFR
jgi:hypothetical protein